MEKQLISFAFFAQLRNFSHDRLLFSFGTVKECPKRASDERNATDVAGEIFSYSFSPAASRRSFSMLFKADFLIPWGVLQSAMIGPTTNIMPPVNPHMNK